MRRFMVVLTAISMVLVAGALPSFAAKAKAPGNIKVNSPANVNQIGAGKSNVGFLELYQQDSSGSIIGDGARGKMKFNLAGSDFGFLFNGHRLDPNTPYTLMRSREPLLTLPYRFEVMASGQSNGGGNLHIAGSYNFDIDLVTAKFLLVPAIAGSSTKHLVGFLVGDEGSIGYDDKDTDLKCGCQSALITGPRDFDPLGLPIGTKGVDFTLSSTEGVRYTLSGLLKDKPVVLITGAYT